ncbi:hypothetical protein MRX96_014989 [Rhipicephalus microplus]
MADEEKLPRYSAIGSGSYSQIHQSAACQDYASYEEDWNIILNYLYESANGNPPIPQSPDANYSADIKAANDQNGGTAIAYECTQTTDNKAVLLLSTSSSIACDDTVPSTSRADKAGASAGNSTRGEKLDQVCRQPQFIFRQFNFLPRVQGYCQAWVTGKRDEKLSHHSKLRVPPRRVV